MAKRQAQSGQSSGNSATRTRSKRRVFRLERLESRHLLAAHPVCRGADARAQRRPRLPVPDGDV